MTSDVVHLSEDTNSHLEPCSLKRGLGIAHIQLPGWKGRVYIPTPGPLNENPLHICMRTEAGDAVDREGIAEEDTSFVLRTIQRHHVYLAPTTLKNRNCLNTNNKTAAIKNSKTKYI